MDLQAWLPLPSRKPKWSRYYLGSPPRQTTALLIEAFVALGHQVSVLQVADLRINTAGVPLAAVVSVRESDLAASTENWVASVRATEPEPLDVSSCGLLLIRTNPGRDLERAWAHSTLLNWAWLVQHLGVPVINDPSGLAKTASKAYTFCLPGAIRPRGVIAAGLEEVRAFVREVDAPCVIKPLVGSRGYNVFVIRDADDAELPRIVDAVTLRGFAIVQEFVRSEMPGDARVVLGRRFRVLQRQRGASPDANSDYSWVTGITQETACKSAGTR